MIKRIRAYKEKLDKLLEENDENTDWEAVSEELLIKISFFQHERLVHLIVTMTVAILLIISFLVSLLVTELTIALLALVGLFIVLTAPYIVHYFNLENAVQDLYKYYDVLREKNNRN